MSHTTLRFAMFLAVFAGMTPCGAQDAKPQQQPGAAKAQTTAPKKPDRIFGIETAKPRPAGTIRVASYNIENLFDDKDDPALKGRHEDVDMTKAEDEMKAAAAAIRAVDADVLTLQEIESKDALIWFRDKYLSGMGYDHVSSIDAGDERGIEQSVLSRFPIVEEKNWVGLDLGGVHPEKWGNNTNERAGQPIKYHRSPLMVTVEAPALPAGGEAAATPAYRLTVVVVHQKSGRDGGYWRQKEAAKTVELLGAIQKEDPNRNIVLLGDFNSVLRDAEMRLVTDAGWYDLFAEAQKQPSTETGKPPEWKPRNDPAIISHASGRIIDHILLNPAAKKEYVDGASFVLGTPVREQKGYASDHYPVVVDLIRKDQ